MADQMMDLTQEQIDDYKEAFNMFDKDGNGSINLKEIGIVMRSLGQNPTEMELENMISEVDEDKSGSIEFNEFLVMMNKKMADSKEEDSMAIPFNLMDKDMKDSINSTDFKNFMSSLGEKMENIELIDQIFLEYSSHGDGNLSMDEFQKLMQTQTTTQNP